MTSDPISLFRDWFAQASQSGVEKPHAMTLCTVGADGRPSARVVLLSSFDEQGFVFHTNYESEKGAAIARNAQVALVLWWDSLGYQVRIEGTAAKTTSAESDAYFAKRPRRSQLSAWASNQSRVIESRLDLEQRMEQLAREYEGRDVPRPPYWGGYRVRPDALEFWEDRRDRLHERQRFARDAAGHWRRVRLAP